MSGGERGSGAGLPEVAVSNVLWRRNEACLSGDAADQPGNLRHEALYGYRAS